MDKEEYEKLIEKLEHRIEIWKRKSDRIAWLSERAERVAHNSQTEQANLYFSGQAEGLNLAWKILVGDLPIRTDPYEDIIGPGRWPYSKIPE